MNIGSNQKGTTAMKSLGMNPKFTLKWAGDWLLKYMNTNGSSTELDSFLKWCGDNGTVPVVLFYYWGDGINDTVLKDSARRAEWNKIGDLIAKRIAASIQPLVYVVLENEFNKGGVTPSVIDPMLRDMANRVKSLGGSKVKIVSGTGSWASTDIYDKYPGIYATSDVLGTQLMRGLTKDDRAKCDATAEYITAWLERIHAKHPDKDQLVFDTTFATYGVGKPYTPNYLDGANPAFVAPSTSSTEEAYAMRAIRGIKDRESRLVASRVLGFVFREEKDNISRRAEKNYYGPAEYYMGWGYCTDGRVKTDLLEAMRYLASVSVSLPEPVPVPAPVPVPPSVPPAPMVTQVEYDVVKAERDLAVAQRDSLRILLDTSVAQSVRLRTVLLDIAEQANTATRL